jgi:hypothetical protein
MRQTINLTGKRPMPDKVFLDSNVPVYAYINKQAVKQRKAKQLIAEMMKSMLIDNIPYLKPVILPNVITILFMTV